MGLVGYIQHWGGRWDLQHNLAYQTRHTDELWVQSERPCLDKDRDWARKIPNVNLGLQACMQRHLHLCIHVQSQTHKYTYMHTLHMPKRGGGVLTEGSSECQITPTWGDKAANREETSLRMLFYRHASTWKLGAVVTGPFVLCVKRGVKR